MEREKVGVFRTYALGTDKSAAHGNEDRQVHSCLQVLACVLLNPLGSTDDGIECGELAAFCVHPSYRGSGRGDSLLDYVEQWARDKGIRRLVRPHFPDVANEL